MGAEGHTLASLRSMTVWAIMAQTVVHNAVKGSGCLRRWIRG
jgi:hypothetical protein